METQRSARRIAHLSNLRDGGAYFVERGTQGGIEPLSGDGEMNARVVRRTSATPSRSSSRRTA